MENIKSVNEYSLLLADLANNRWIKRIHDKEGTDFCLNFDPWNCFVTDKDGVIQAKGSLKDGKVSISEYSDGFSESDIEKALKDGTGKVRKVVCVEVSNSKGTTDTVLWDVPNDYIERFPMLSTVKLSVFGVELFDD